MNDLMGRVIPCDDTGYKRVRTQFISQLSEFNLDMDKVIKYAKDNDLGDALYAAIEDNKIVWGPLVMVIGTNDIIDDRHKITIEDFKSL